MNFAAPGWPETLYQEKAGALILYGRALGLSHSESEDVLQETFLALLRLPTRPEEPERYCLRAFRNRALNYHRSVWRRLAREWESVAWFERHPTNEENETQALQGLKQLPPEQREVIVLKIWHGMTFEEIGRLLETSPNTVAGRYRYGLNKLRFFVKGSRYERDRSIGEPVAVMDSASPFA
ncbi:MAG TPA: sigma-70 family RNA polymerase sigma factor [Verrucomicrobiae bacterium]|nr:sigma-70 family RNA polymerase sigma factor [Verrucomicrobiae bacterium]